MMCKLGVIGGGNMGEAIVRGAIRNGVLSPADIHVAELNSARRDSLAALGCRVTDDAREVLECEQLLLAIKPQGLDDLAKLIAPLPRSVVVMSILAGKSSSSIRSALGEQARVLRIMPNTPCQIGAGMSALALGEGAKGGDESLARAIFDAIGKCIVVNEQLLDAVTAVSGSGPAYVFLLAESMEQAAMKVGLSHHDARVLVAQTILGAARLLTETEQSADQLRQAVTSPGGTTAAAIEVMFEKELPEIVSQAITAARDRGRDLGA